MSLRPWIVQPVPPQAFALASKLQVSNALAALLCNRGYQTPQEALTFLEASRNQIRPPAELPGAEEAGRILCQAAKDKSSIWIYGDYDVDGTTGSSILYRTLSLLEANVRVYTPNRLREGYGLHLESVRRIAKAGCKILCTVDCGITAAAQVRLARSLGMEVIVTDHHEYDSDGLPQALLVHPKLPNNPAPSEICGSCVAWKVAWSILQCHAKQEKLPYHLQEHIEDCMVLAAFGTVADVMPLRGENRAIVKAGLARLARTEDVTLEAIMHVAEVDRKKLCAEDIGFRIGPRFNAAGRMGCAGKVVELLTQFRDDPDGALSIAEYLDRQNGLRKQIEARMTEEAMLQAEKQLQYPILMVYGEDWHPGVIGIVASRLVDRYSRPTLIAAFEHGVGHGSGRSPRVDDRGLSLHKALDYCHAVLSSHGGHAAAAGFRIKRGNWDAFCDRAREYATGLPPGTIQIPLPLKLDARLTIEEINTTLMADLEKLEPCGAGNTKPLFLIDGCKVEKASTMGSEKTHLNLQVSQAGRKMRVVAFGKGSMAKDIAKAGYVDLAASPQWNNWMGRKSLELYASDIRLDL